MRRRRRYLQAALLLVAITIAGLLTGLTKRWSEHHEADMHGILLEPQFLDLGDVGEHGAKNGTVTLTNRRSGSLEIVSVRTDCGCTTGAPSKTRIGPGEKTEINIAYKASPSAPGEINRTIVVEALVAEHTVEVPIRVSGRVVPDTALTAFPTFLDLGDVRAGALVEREVFFRGSANAIQQLPKELRVAAGERSLHSINFGTAVRDPDIRGVRFVISVPHVVTVKDVSEQVVLEDCSSGRRPDIAIWYRLRIVPTGSD